MSTASISYIEYDPAEANFTGLAKETAEKGRANGHTFATYVPVDGEGMSVTVILHEEGSEAAQAAEAAEEHSKHPETGAAALSEGAKGGVSKHYQRTAHISSHGEDAGAKPFALVFVVSYDADKADAIKDAGKALAEAKPSFRYHIVRRNGVAGHVLVVVPVDALDELDGPVDGAQAVIDVLKDAVTDVTLIKTKRLAEYSS